MNAPLTIDDDFPAERELVIERMFDAPREKVYRAWTEPMLVKQWFAPLPWTTSGAALDVRPGGRNEIVMRDPDGKDYPSAGVLRQKTAARHYVMEHDNPNDFDRFARRSIASVQGY